MTWDWLDTAAPTVLGLAGIFATWKTGKDGRDHAERVQSERLEHERELASDARQQARIEAAYLRMLGMVEQVGAWANRVKPMIDTNPPSPDPDLPSVELQTEVEAYVGAFGSDAVRERFETWTQAVLAMIASVGMINLARAERERGERGSGLGDSYLKLHEQRPVEREARIALAAQVRAELRGTSRGGNVAVNT